MRCPKCEATYFRFRGLSHCVHENCDFCELITEEYQSYNHMPRVECSYCHSTNTKKISTVGRILSTEFWGQCIVYLNKSIYLEGATFFMSLIICSECGKEISDKSSVCIHCGCPIEKVKELNTSKKFVYMCMSACLSNPFKEFDEYDESLCVCPDCGGQLVYHETIIIDNDTDLVVKRYEEKSLESLQNTQSPNIPKCPICSSTNLSKISSINKATKISLFGIFGAGDVGKTYKCNNCGSKF